MQKRHYPMFLALFVALFLVASGARGAIGPVSAMLAPDRAGLASASVGAHSASNPQDALTQAWTRARDAGSYRFLATADQTMLPRAVPEMLGQSDVRLTLENRGAVVLPDRSYIEVRVAGLGQDNTAAMLRNGNQSFLLQDGALKPTDDAFSLATPTNDLLGYLAAAEQVTLLDPPPGHPELVRYGFQISGARLAEYVRQLAESELRAQPAAPAGLTAKTSPVLQALSGSGELWVNEAGLPVREIVDARFPQVSQTYDAQVHMVVDLSGYGQVAALPKAVQGADGTWRLEGGILLPTTMTMAPTGEGAAGATNLVAATADSAATSPSVAASASAAWLHSLSGLLPLRVDPESVALFVLIAVGILVVRLYRREPRLCYALIVAIVLPIMMFSPLLQAGQVVQFTERQALASDTRTGAASDLLNALGLQSKAEPAFSAAQTGADNASVTDQPSASDPGSASKSVTASVSLPSTVASKQAPLGGGLAPAPASEGGAALLRCGDGESGDDADQDGLADQVEMCLGTNPYSVDTDGDSITDTLEISGFDYGGKHWDSDPLKADTNQDGVLDILEWSDDLAPNKGQASSIDLDNDGIPNLWDDDNDNDGVPDSMDLSPSTMTDFATSVSLSTDGGGFGGYETIQIQVRPAITEHLRYSLTALDWPDDSEGNIRDLDQSTDDLRLIPYLVVDTNVAPTQALAEKYGFRFWSVEDGYVLMIPATPIQDGGAIRAFAGQVAYAPGQTDSIRWQIRLVWMVEMQDDRWQDSPPMVITSGRVVQQYDDSFCISGLSISKDTGFEAAVLGTPVQPDDLALFKLYLGMSGTFNGALALEGQQPGETALQEIAQRFAVGSTANITHTFGIDRTDVAVVGPTQYLHKDAGVAGVGSDLVPNFLQDYESYYGNARCTDAAGNPVNCATLLMAYESSQGSMDLRGFAQTSSGTTDLASLHVDLSDIPLVTTRGLQIRMYEERSNGWQVTTPARMLELMGQRYASLDNTSLDSRYPHMTAEGLQFLTYCGYLWVTAPLQTVISVDGRTVVQDLADETQAAIQRGLPADEEAAAATAIDWFAYGTGLGGSVGTGVFIVWVTGDWIKLVQDVSKDGWKIDLRFDLWCAVLFLVSTVASTIMAVINAICAGAPDLKMCQNEDALYWANCAVNSLAIVYQSFWLAQTIISLVKGTLDKFVSGFAQVSIIIGYVITIAITWANFIYLAVMSVGDPVAWRVGLAEAITSTVWQTFMLLLNLIPIAGQIIVIILQLIDMLVSLFTWLFADKTYSVATAILNLFYDAHTLTSPRSAGFGTFRSGLADPALGLVGGNTMELSIPAYGVMQQDGMGEASDLDKSWIKGDISWAWSDWTAEEQAALFEAQSMTTDPTGVLITDTKAFSNTAAAGYALTPRVNGLVAFLAEHVYQYVWVETAFYDSVRWKTHTDQKTIPAEADTIEPNAMYVDVLPATVSDLWWWRDLADNPDLDGDGLTYVQELALHTDPLKWDSDGDRLSDWYEWQAAATHSLSPLSADSDGDGLDDGFEVHIGTRPDAADSDGDGLTDGQEVRSLQDGQIVGGWQITVTGGVNAWVASDPMRPDADHDGLNDAEEKANGLSPYAANALVPTLSLSVSPLRSVGSGRAGAFWSSGEDVEFKIKLSNGAGQAVTTTLVLELPAWLTNIQGGVMQGDRTPALGTSGTTLHWSFSGTNALLGNEQASTTITARTSGSGSGQVVLRLPYGNVQLRKAVEAVMDGDDPNVAIMAPASGAYLRGASYVVGGSATDPTTWITERSLSIVSQGQAANYQALPLGQGPWAYSWSLPTTDGVYALQARATDAMQHQKTTSPVTVTVDSTAPSATMDATVVSGKVRLSGAATDNLSGVAWVQLGIDAQPWHAVSLTGEGATSASWSYDWAVSDSAQGDHHIALRVVDRCGNTSAVISQTITVDRVAPSSDLTGGASAGVPPAVKASSTFTLTGVADEGGHLPLPAAPSDLRMGMGVYDDAPLWLGVSTIHENDGGVLAAWCGDFNADRLADLAVGLPGPSGSAGQVIMLYGRAGGWPTPPDLEMLADSLTRLVGAPGSQLGSYVAAAGDVNGDSMADLLIGERSSTRAFLVFGNPGPLGEMTLDSGLAAYRALLQAPATIEGLATAGDVNGDGYDDLLVRAGGTAYLLLGQTGLWPETVTLSTAAEATWAGAEAALGVGDVNADQRAEWVVTTNAKVTLYKWDTSLSPAAPATVSAWTVSDTAPRAAALGDVDGDGKTDWLYSNGATRTLIYGDGATPHDFAGYDGLFAAPGDVDGDGRGDLLLATSAGLASLIRQQEGESAPEEFATISGVGGVANAPHAAGADLNADGSSDLLLIPSRAAAEARGFDAPDFSSGFVSPQALPQGVTSGADAGGDAGVEPAMLASSSLESAGPDTRYVDDDGLCDGNTPCDTTIQAAISATDGGGDTIIVYPGVYAGFRVPAEIKYNNLTVRGVDPDAVFVEDISSTVTDAIQVAADGVRLANLTVRNVMRGIVLEDGAGLPTTAGGSETYADRIVAHSTKNAIAMDQNAALTLRDSTLVGDGQSSILQVQTSDYWAQDQAVPLPAIATTVAITGFGALASAGGNLYALAGGDNSAIYQATPGADGSLGNWSQPFSLRHPLPTDTGTAPLREPTNVVAGSGSKLYQLHGTFSWPNFGDELFNEEVLAVAVSPTTGDVYVGGVFTKIGTMDAFHVARWDGTSWHTLGNGLEQGLNGTVRALVCDAHGNVYIGGDFAKLGNNPTWTDADRPMLHVVGWGPDGGDDGSGPNIGWFALGQETTGPNVCNGVSDAGGNVGGNVTVYALAYDISGDYLYVGGSFAAANSTCTSGNAQPYINSWTWHWQQRGYISAWSNWALPLLDAPVRALSLGNGRIYVAGDFTGNVGSFVISVPNNDWHTLVDEGTGATVTSRAGVNSDLIAGLAAEPTAGHVSIALCDGGVWQWGHGGTWTKPGGQLALNGVTPISSFAVLVDTDGNLVSSGWDGYIMVQYGATGDFRRVGRETNSPPGWQTNVWINDLALASNGRIYSASSCYKAVDPTNHLYWQGFLSAWAVAGFFGRTVPSGSWTQYPYPPAPELEYSSYAYQQAPTALAGDGNGDLYGISGDFDSNGDSDTGGRLTYYSAISNTWALKANPPSSLAFKHLVWADGKVYALGHTNNLSSAVWYLYRYDPAANSWSRMAMPSFIANGAGSAAGLSWAWDGGDYIYILAGAGTNTFRRYRISTDVISSLPASALSFSVSYGPAMARIGSQLYAYVTNGSESVSNLVRYGPVGLSDLRLTVERTAFVEPDTATTGVWINLDATARSYRFQTDIGSSNAFVGPSGLAWSPTRPAGAASLTTAQAAFVSPADGLYRLGADSELAAGYRQYKGTAHVYTSQAACAECESGELTWGVDAYATVRAAVESGASRVLVHPGRYPQSFYLVSGVEVMGFGAENTIIEAPAGATGTLVTAEGVAHASLSRVTLAGRAGWQGFLAEGGATGIAVMRNIVRDLGTGLLLRGGSEVEVVNNTLVRNANGLVAEGTNPVHVRNSIFAFHSGVGLSRGASSSLSNTYNDFYANGTDMDNLSGDVGGGKLYRNPQFRDLASDDLRLAAGSPLMDMGAPNDPTPPGTGARTDIGYAEYNAAGFYASTSYSAAGLNDGLTWGVDAFSTVQGALDAAAATLRGLQGALPDGGYSVGVDTGIYTETVSVPSHVRLVGSGADVTTLNANNAGSAVTFDGVIDAQVEGLRLTNAASSGAGVEVKGASSAITIERNVITGNAAQGVSLAGGSSGAVDFNTIADNDGTGVLADGAGTWATVRNNIIVGQDAYGLQATNGGLLRQDYGLFHNNASGDLSGVAAGDHTLTGDPAFAATNYYLTADSPALDAADPQASAPLAGGVRADLGYKELIASPLTLILGPQIASAVTGNSGVAQVEVGVTLVSDPTQPVTATLPTAWTTLTGNSQGLYYWKRSLSLATSGLYRVYSKATDAKGNGEEQQADWYEGALVVDSTAPTVNWGAPDLPSNTTAAAVRAVASASGTVSTGAGTRSDLKQLYFGVQGPSGAVTYPATWDGAAYQAWIPLPVAGSYTVKAVALDEAGNQAETSTKTVVVTSGNVATVERPTAGSAVKSTSVTLRGYVRFAAAGAGVVVATASVSTTATLETPGAPFSAWTATISLSSVDGSQNVTVTPSQGGTAGATTTLSLTLDTAAPTLSLDTPAVGTTVTETVSFAGVATDSGSGVAAVEVSVDGGYTWRQATLSDDDWSLSWNLGADQDYVSYPVRVRATDLAGNAALVERVVTVDNVPPTDLSPVSFGQPVEQHLEVGAVLSIAWRVPQDASGAATVYWAADRSTDTVPTTLAGTTSVSVTLDAVGDWYVHLMAQDAIGNQSVYHYGPWHVRDMANSTFSARRQSIVLDGLIDLEHGEWLPTDLLGTDSRSGRPQELYLSWDGQAVFLGWSGAWWTLDGSLWAYLDVAPGGSSAQVNGNTLPTGLYADYAVEIRTPGDGALWTYAGASWQSGALTFANGSEGDTEVRIPWPASASGSVSMVAMALTRAAESAEGLMLAAAGSGARLQETAPTDPWAVFPATNPLSEDVTQEYQWNDVTTVSDIDAGQPQAWTVVLDATSAQPTGMASCPTNELTYDITVQNMEQTAVVGLSLQLTATTGLSYQSQTGATCIACAAGGSAWTLAIPALAGGATSHVTVTASLAASLTGLTAVTSTFDLTAGAIALTDAPQRRIISHRVDGQAPTVTIAAPPGAAIRTGLYTFTGAATDGDGSGLARVEVRQQGAPIWTQAVGALAWSAALVVPTGATQFTLEARAVDACGKSATATLKFAVDSTPPTLSWTLPAVLTSTVAALSGSTSDPAPASALVRSVHVQLDSAASAWYVASGPFAPDNGAQAWEWVWTVPPEDGTTHQLRARAMDAAGNQTEETNWQSTVVDVVAPRITVTEQLDNVILPDGDAAGASSLQSWGDSPSSYGVRISATLPRHDSARTMSTSKLLATTLLSGTVSDGAGVQAVHVWIYGPQGSLSMENASLNGSSWTYAPDMAGWKPGSYALRVEAADIYGNATSLQGPYQLTAQDAPVVGLTATNSGPELVGHLVTLAVTATHGSNVTYTWDLGDGSSSVHKRIAQHAYTDDGTYTTTVTATNSVSTLVAHSTVTVVTLSVEAGAGQTVDEGDSVSVAASFTDGRPQVSHSATIAWGDGAQTAGTVDEAARTIAASHAFADNGVYTVTVTMDDGKGNATSDTLRVTVSNVAPTIALSGAASVPEGLRFYTLSLGAITDPGSDTVSAWVVHWGDGSTTTYDSGGNKTHMYVDGPTSPTITVDLTDEDGTHTGAGSLGVTVTNVAPAVAVNAASQTVQYSEAIAGISFTARDVALDPLTAASSWRLNGGVPKAGLPSGLTLSAKSCSPPSAGVLTCTWTVAGIARVPAGTYGLTLAVTDGDGGTTSRNATLRVLAEDANVAFDGANPVAVKAEPGATSGSFTLKVRVSEADTTSRGSISLARVTMSLVPLGSGTSIVRVGAGTVQNGVLVVPFNFSKVPVGTYDVQVTVNGGYYAGSGEDVLVVYDPSLGYTSGGGWFYWPNTARSGYAGDRTTFGFTTRYDQNGANLQGNLLLIRHLANGTFYRVRSNALSGLVLGENTSVPMGYASFSGGGSFRSPGSPGPVGCVLKVYVEDRNAPGTGTDRFWIQVTDGIAMSSPATQYAVNLGGGNIVVPHKAR